jgi:metallo-beta-lactamase class B
MRRFLHVLLAAAFLLVPLTSTAQKKLPHPDWTTPIAPFRIADNLYYVGSRDLASYLITTPAGNVLINSSLQSSVPLIRHSVEQLGFRWVDTKILLISHSHDDHDAGSAAVVAQTHARYMVMDADVPVVEDGGRTDFAYGGRQTYPITHVDRTLHDRDTVTLGNVTLTAHKTPGHTRGCTTWTLRTHVPGDPVGKLRDAVIVGSWNVNPGFRLVASHGKPASYPNIREDYVHTFQVLASLPCDIFLGAHGAYFNMLDKLNRMPQQHEAVWIDPQGYRAAVAERKAAFERELATQQATAGKS